METVSVIGLGAMGSQIALRLLDAGYRVIVWNRTAHRLEPLLERGACAASSPREAARQSNTLITMLADPEALRSVSIDLEGISAGNHVDLVVVEMSTVGPAAAARLTSLLGSKTRVVDAPVMGSIHEAEAGALTILAGARDDDLERVRPVLSALGTVVHVGEPGAGASAKLVANAALLGTLTVLGETLALASALGLSPRTAAGILDATPLAEQMRRRLPLIEAGTYPLRFSLSLAHKDADLIVGASANTGLTLPALEAVHKWLGVAAADGHGDRDYTALLATILASASRTPDMNGRS
jgi:3-hydroxyisobutyrate dehydrogenase-like beta-hydroxyacid dehydrogenase